MSDNEFIQQMLRDIKRCWAKLRPNEEFFAPQEKGDTLEPGQGNSRHAKAGSSGSVGEAGRSPLAVDLDAR